MDTRNRITIPETGFLRLSQIISAIIPVSKSTWWAGVKNGHYPHPVKLSTRCTAWRAEDIRALIERIASGGEVQP
jgi:predicted DNA-binding transcriptional regulator AlpA